MSAIDHKSFALEWKAEADGSIEGYASIFGNVDQGGDQVAKGAFRASLKKPRQVKMLRDHDTRKVIGVWDELLEDATGLRVKGHLILSVAEAQETYDLVKAGALDGLSIGYRTTKAKMDASGVRIIQEAELWEVSVVTFPMNELAVIDAVKAADMTERDMERRLMQDAGFSRSVARRLMAGGLNAVKAMQDAGADREDLWAALRARAQLHHA
jgi:HK97 family phage prohead protease